MADETVVEEAPVAVEEVVAEVAAPVEDVPAEVAVAPVEAPVAVAPVDYQALAQRTIDAHEVSVGWTCQQGDVPSEPEAVPGTVVTVAELPDKASLVAAGVDLDQYFSGLHAAVVADDVERDVVRGVTA